MHPFSTTSHLPTACISGFFEQAPPLPNLYEHLISETIMK